MRSIVGIGIFILLGLLTAIMVGFQPSLSGPLPYDDEQKGLNDRIIIKFSHVVAENTPKGLAAEHFASLVKEKTNDLVEIQVFPNGILYSDKDEINALQRGDIQMIAPAFSNLSGLIPAWLAMDLPFAFPNQNAVNEAFHGTIGKMLFQTLEHQDMKGLAFWSNGFKQMTSSQRPLIQPDDFKNQTFRILPSRVLESQFRLLGARAVPIPFNEVYSNLEKRSADGQENTISNIYSKRLFQVQQYMTISNHGYLGYAVIVNKSFWNKLKPDIRQNIMEAMDETTEWNNLHAVSINQTQLKLIQKAGSIQMHELTAEERKNWISALNPIYDQYNDEIGRELIDQIQHLRNRYLNIEQ